MKRHELLFGLAKLPIEFTLVVGSFFLARNLRQSTDLIPHIRLPIQYVPDDSLIIFATL